MKDRVYIEAYSPLNEQPVQEDEYTGVHNPSHSSFDIVKHGKRCWLGVATYKNTGNKAVVLRKAFNWGTLTAFSEYVISTIQDEPHLKAVLDYARDMVEHCDQGYYPDKPYLVY